MKSNAITAMSVAQELHVFLFNEEEKHESAHHVLVSGHMDAYNNGRNTQNIKDLKNHGPSIYPIIPDKSNRR